MTVKLNQHCIGVVLTGGLSSRMGTDKALLTREHESMLSFSCQQLKLANVSEVVISGKQHGIADCFENLGPMGGIYTIIDKYRPNALLLLPVDLPLIDSELLLQLKRVGELSQQACFYQDSFLPLYLPITAFVEQFFKKSFSQFTPGSTSTISAEKKGPSIRSLIEQIPHSSLTITNKQGLFNTNTPEQWQQAQQKIKHQRMNRRIKNV